ncbi:MAG: hypothetical protein J5486_00170 [Bacteroidaceae bacterium]|nr:hypothetical protein [Bacteroidaceae bacterium]
MNISQTKVWIQENVNLNRGETEVCELKDYAITFASAGLLMGAIVCTLVVLSQFFLSGIETQQTFASIVSTIASTALLVYIVWFILPVLRSGEISIGNKILTAVLAIVCAFATFVIGVYLAMLFFIGLCILFALWFAGKLFGWWVEDSSRSTTHHHHSSGPDTYLLDNGTKVTDTGFGSYSGDDGHSYSRGIGGDFTRKD